VVAFEAGLATGTIHNAAIELRNLIERIFLLRLQGTLGLQGEDELRFLNGSVLVRLCVQKRTGAFLFISEHKELEMEWMDEFPKCAHEYLSAPVNELVTKVPTGVAICQKYRCRTKKAMTPPVQHVLHEERTKEAKDERAFNSSLYSSSTIASHGTLTANLVGFTIVLFLAFLVNPSACAGEAHPHPVRRFNTERFQGVGQA